MFPTKPLPAPFNFMSRNVIWVGCVLLVACLALWFIVKGGYALFSYYQLSTQIPTAIEKWSVEEIKSNQFAVIAHYTFEYKGKNYQEMGRVGDLYPNPWAAHRAQKQLATQQWPAWLNPRHPEKAVLEKKFPYKQAISGGVLIGLLIYFLILGTYVSVKHGR
jgi:Protein of unknown function (DUF3592)